MRTREYKAAIVVYNYFEQSELEQPLAFLRGEGIPTTVVSCSSKNLRAMQGHEPGDTFTADLLINETKASDYDLLVLPGGVINADYLRMEDDAKNWVNHFFDKKKLVAAMCHAPWLLVSADVVEERRLTSYYTLQDDIRNAGGEWSDQPVIVDGNLITSRKPADLKHFNSAIVDWLARSSHGQKM